MQMLTCLFYEEHNAGNAINVFMDSFAPKAKVMHNGTWAEIESADLVPSDMISFKIVVVVPANCHLMGLSMYLSTKHLLPVNCFLTARSLVIKYFSFIFFTSPFDHSMLMSDLQ